MAYLKGFRLQKKYIAFLTVVPLLMVTALVPVDCPVCEGDGFLSSMPGMENVKLTRIQSNEKDILRDACSMYLMYNYDIILSLTNEGSDTVVGFVKLVLIDFSEGEALSTQYTVIEIPGESTLDIAYNVWFETGLDEPLKTEVNAEVLIGEVPDKTCNGTGKLSLNTLFLADSLKSSFQEISRVELPFTSPSGWQWEEWQWEDE